MTKTFCDQCGAEITTGVHITISVDRPSPEGRKHQYVEFHSKACALAWIDDVLGGLASAVT